MTHVNSEEPIVIAGAGITGCVIARELSSRGYKVVVIEKDPRVGGLSKTFRYHDFAFDVGPHRFFTNRESTSNFIRTVLKDDYAVLPRRSEVFFLGRHYHWPLRPTVLFTLPLSVTLQSAWDLLRMLARNGRKEAQSFEDYIKRNYGPSLYNIFFRDYTRKFLGLSPSVVHAEWAKEGMKKTVIDESIASRNLIDILRLFFVFKPTVTEFLYPREGIGVFCERLADEVRGNGGEILLNSGITGIRRSAQGIEEVRVNGSRMKAGTLVWTASLEDLCRMAGLQTGRLEYLSLLLFNVEISGPPVSLYQWCYYGSEDIVFSRVTIPSVFSRQMSPGSGHGLCAEVTCREGDRKWSDPGALIEPVIRDLMRVGMLSRRQDVRDVHVEKIPDAYPVYTLQFPRFLTEVKKELAEFKNLIPAGRTGLFWYNNMDECIENGLEVAEAIIKKRHES